MKKDKKWLRDEINNLYEDYIQHDWNEAIGACEELVDQLDEPQKVVVPKWFDEWAKQKASPATDGLDSAYFMVEDYIKSRFTQDQDLYIKKHWRNILLAFANGYEVEEKEKENLYWVRDKCDCALLRRVGDSLMQSNSAPNCVQEATPENYQFTEEEIKDYDERYVPFMVPVEEVEE